MKLSRYNWLVEHENDVVAYNGFTGAMARLKPENVPAVRKLFDSEDSINQLLKGMPEDLREGLSHGGYVIDDELDERKLLRISFNMKKFSYPDRINGFTLIMTRRCNFRCVYCFEQDTLCINDSITDEVIDRVVQLAGQSTAEVFTITLYGGEPLLESDKCIEVCRRCKEAVENRGGKFKAGLISNGYLLTPQVAEQLSRYGVEYIQITVDGSKNTHNMNRPLASGGGTYDRIMENINDCAGKINIQIRMNTKKADLREFDELRNRLKDHPEIKVGISPVDLSCQGDDEFYDNLKKKLASRLPSEMMKLGDIYSVIGGCAATSFRPVVVLPDGKLSRCWEHVRDTQSSCTVFDDPVEEDRIEFSEWLGWDPYVPGSRCFECSFLPGCGGGCPKEAVETGRPKCRYVNDDEYRKSIIGSYISLTKNKKKSGAGVNSERRRDGLHKRA